MAEETDRYGQFSSTDVLKKKLIDFTMSQCIKACEKQEPVSDDTFETGFIRGVRLTKSMLWKYTPDEVREPIKKLYLHLDTELEKIDSNETLNIANKRLNKRIIADKISMQVLELLLVVLQHSPLSIEYMNMEVFGDYQDLIKSIRKTTKVKLYSGELSDD